MLRYIYLILIFPCVSNTICISFQLDLITDYWNRGLFALLTGWCVRTCIVIYERYHDNYPDIQCLTISRRVTQYYCVAKICIYYMHSDICSPQHSLMCYPLRGNFSIYLSIWTVVTRTHSFKFSINSEASASELIENLEEMFPRYEVWEPYINDSMDYSS